jgi:hypothetical protein
MSSVYAGTATAPVSITIPDDGDAAAASSVNTPLQAHQDFIVYLQGKIPIVYDNGIVQFTAITQDAAWETPGSGANVDVLNCAVGDTIVISGGFNVKNDEATTVGHQMRAVAIDDQAGLTTGPTTVVISGARAWCGPDPLTQYSQVTVVGEHTVATAGTTRIQLQGLVETAGDTMRWVGAGHVLATHYKGGV